MAILNLVKTGRGDYYLQGTGDPSRNADFSIYDWDGEGGDPFQFVSGEKWEIVKLPGLSQIVHTDEGDSVVQYGVEYDADDTDSFWSAQAEIVKAAVSAGIDVPDYAKG